MERSDVWFIAVVCAVLGIIVGVAWVDFWNEANPIKEYQTLITGLAAVAAAFATINAMQRTEERQAERHVELIRLNLRAERLRALRAANHYPSVFRAIADEWEKTINDIKNIITTDEVWTSEDTDALGELQQALNAMREDAIVNLRRRAIAEVIDLFDDKAALRHEVLQQYLSDFPNYSARQMLTSNIQVNRLDNWKPFVAFQMSPVVLLREFADHLEDLADTYR